MIEIRSYTLEGLAFPLVHEPAGAPGAYSERDVLELLRERRHELLGQLHRHGALLFRGFSVEGARALAGSDDTAPGTSEELPVVQGVHTPEVTG